MEEEVVYMKEEEFDGRLQEVFAAFMENHTYQKDVIGLMLHRKEDMDSISYLQILYMKGLAYEQADNKNAARYCAMRMLHVRECMCNPSKKHSPLLSIMAYDIPEEMNAFIDRYTDFLADTDRYIQKKLLLLSAVVWIIAFFLLFVLVKSNVFVAMLEALVLAIVDYCLQRKRVSELFRKKQLDALTSYVEKEVLEFDRIYA